jgi:hypothetical protein
MLLHHDKIKEAYRKARWEVGSAIWNPASKNRREFIEAGFVACIFSRKNNCQKT